MKHRILNFALLFTIILLTTLKVSAQQQKAVEKSMYLDEKQKRLYIQMSLPVYFFMSTNPDGKDAVRLQSESKLANPMRFDGNGIHFIQHNDIHEPEVVKFEIYADNATPSTTINFGAAPLYTRKDTLFVGKGLTSILTAKDELSGVKEVYLSIDNADFQLYNEAPKFETQKSYKFQFYGVDNVGNVETVKSKQIIADFTAPQTEYTISGDKSDNILSPRTSISLKSADALSGVQAISYKIDDGKLQNYYNPIMLTNLPEGNHTLTFFATDNVKNEETAKVYAFYLDRTAPIVVDEVMGNQFVSNGKAYSSGRTKFKLTAVDNKSGVKEIYYSLNGASYELYDKPFYLPTKAGGMMIRYYATDNVNNKGLASSENKSSSATYLDLTGPNLKHAYKGPFFQTRDTVFINKNTEISLQAIDPESGVNKIGYLLDNGQETDFSGPIKVESEGTHKIDYIGYDNVENTNRTSFMFVIDNQPPTINVKFSIDPIGKKTVLDKNYPIYPSYVQIFLSGTDKKVGANRIFYTLNKTSERVFTGIISGLTKRTNYELKVRCLDELGNESIDTFFFATED